MDATETQPFISAIRVEHGDRALIGRRLLEGIGALRDRGIEPHYTDNLRRLAYLNKQYPENWPTLFPALDPDIAGFSDADSFMIEGRLSSGELAFTDAARILRLGSSTLKEEMESFRAYYRDPDQQRHSDEEITITAPSAARISGNCALIGGVWINPKMRGSHLAEIFTPMVRWYAFTRYNVDWAAAFVHAKAVQAGVARHYGYQTSEPLITMRTRAVQGTLHLISQTREQIEAHIRLGAQNPIPLVRTAEHDESSLERELLSRPG